MPPQLQHVFWVSKLCFLYSALSPPSMLLSRWRDLCWLGARSSRSESALDSIKVARCTSVSAVSHIMSLTWVGNGMGLMLMVISLVVLTGSFGSILSRCWRIERNGIS